MFNPKRITKIETTLTPKQAVLLWLRQEYRGKTLRDYVRWLIQQSVGAAPRIRVEKQVVEGIRAAMKGLDPVRVQRAAREGQMQTDFLLLLVSETNRVILYGGGSRWLQIALLLARLRSAIQWDDEEAHSWTADLWEFTAELFSIQAATKLIQDRYFDGESVLLKDAVEDLEPQTVILQGLMAEVDRVLIEEGYSELAADPAMFSKAVNERASKKANYIIALAKSRTLADFGDVRAANVVLKPYLLENRLCKRAFSVHA